MRMLQHHHADGVNVVGDAVDGDASVLIPVNLPECLTGVLTGNSDLMDLRLENIGYKT